MSNKKKRCGDRLVDGGIVGRDMSNDKEKEGEKKVVTACWTVTGG